MIPQSKVRSIRWVCGGGGLHTLDLSECDELGSRTLVWSMWGGG